MKVIESILQLLNIFRHFVLCDILNGYYPMSFRENKYFTSGRGLPPLGIEPVISITVASFVVINPVDIAAPSALNDHDPLTTVNSIFVFLGNLKLAYPVALT